MVQLTFEDVAAACEIQSARRRPTTTTRGSRTAVPAVTGRRLTLQPEFRLWRHRLGPAATWLLFDLIDLATPTQHGHVLAQPLRAIATAAGASKDTVRRTIRNLEAAGVLEQIQLGLNPLDLRAYLLHPAVIGITIVD